MERSAGDPMSDLPEQLPAKARAVLEADWDSFSSDNPKLRPLRILGLLIEFGGELTLQGLFDEFETMAAFRLARLQDEASKRQATDVRNAVLALFEQCANPGAEKIAALSNRVDDEIQIVEWVGGRTKDGREKTPHIVQQTNSRDPETGESVVLRSLHEVRHAWCKFVADRSRLDTQFEPESLNDEFEEALAWASKMASLFPGQDSVFQNWRDCLEELRIEGELEEVDGYLLVKEAIVGNPDAALKNRNWADQFITRESFEQIRNALSHFVGHLPLQSSSEMTGEVHETPGFFARHNNNQWRIRLPGDCETVHSPDRVGLIYIQHLIGAPHTDISPPELKELTTPGADSMARGATSDDLFDDIAKQQFETRVREIQAERVEAKRCGDTASQAQLEAELHDLAVHVERASGLRGKPRQFATEYEKQRKAVRKAIKEAIDHLRRIGGTAIADHLESAVKFEGGPNERFMFSYEPESDLNWVTTIAE